MPNLPELQTGYTFSAPVTQFGGYNHNLAIQDGEWYEEVGLCSDEHPLFSVRKVRAVIYDAVGIPHEGGLFFRDGIGYTDGAHVYYKGSRVLGIELADGTRKQCVQMGAYVCIFPDAVYFNTTDLSDAGYMGAKYTLSGGLVKAAICKMDGSEYGDIPAQDTPPENPTDNQHWIDTSEPKHVLKVWSESLGMWSSQAVCYVKLTMPRIGEKIQPYDAVTIKGLRGSEQIEALNAEGVYIYGADRNSIIIAGILDHSVTEIMDVVIERKVPQMDYVCEVNNRLWGCRYGMTDGKFLNEIYACKLGDFKNWHCYTGLSTDSYTVSLGSEGAFTGCVHYGGSAVFFKENTIHKVYGSQPSAFQLSTISARGVMDGCGGSVQTVGEYVYYKSRTDFCAFDGSSQPVSISDALGSVQYDNANAGVLGMKYVVSMREVESGKYKTLEYDTKRNIWHVVSNDRFIAFASREGECYAVKDNGSIYTLNGSEGTPEPDETIVWHCESGIIGYNSTNQQYVSRFEWRMKLDPGAHVSLWIEYDSDGVWQYEGTVKRAGTGVFCIPVVPRRCDHFRLKLEGRGRCYIYTMTKTMEGGSTEAWRTY